MLFSLLQADSLHEIAGAIAANAAAPAAPVQQEMSFSLISMASKGGWLMLVLLALSIAAIYLFGQKWWMIHKAGQIDRNFMDDIRDYLHEGKLKSAVTLCTKYDSPIARMVEKGLERIGRPFSSLATSALPTFSTAVWMSLSGRPILSRPFSTILAIGESYFVHNVTADLSFPSCR